MKPVLDWIVDGAIGLSGVAFAAVAVTLALRFRRRFALNEINVHAGDLFGANPAYLPRRSSGPARPRVEPFVEQPPALKPSSAGELPHPAPTLAANPTAEPARGPVQTPTPALAERPRHALVCKGFGVAFGTRVILAEVDLTVADRQVVVLLGPGGTGKSTLLRSLAGVFAKSGTHRTWGEVVYRDAPLSQEDAPLLVRQRIELTRRSVLDGLTFHIPMEELSLEGRRAWAESYLERLGVPELSALLDRPFLDLGAADQRKIAILREAVGEPALLMIDEPTAELSEIEAAEVLALITLLGRRMAILVTLHNQKEARQIAQSVALLAGGRVQEQASPEEFFERSSNPVVRQFVLTGSCSVPAPDATRESLADDVPPPPPLPSAAMSAVSSAIISESVLQNGPPPAGWMHALPPRPAPRGRGPRGFTWIIEGWLAGMPLPGAVDDLDYDLDLLKRLGVTTLVSLTERSLDASVAAAHGIEVCALPIVDGRAPELADAQAVVARIRNDVEGGGAVAVQCSEGVGRTGSVLAACLIDGKDLSAAEALATLRSLKPSFVKTREQEAFLDAYEKARRLDDAGDTTT